jgi:hypothetical protein
MSETTNTLDITAGESTPAVLKEKELLYFGRRVELGSRKVQIVRVEKFNLIPKTAAAKSIRDEVTLKIGSQWKKGTRDIIRGLSVAEERKYLPKILGVSDKSEKWEERTLEHWANYSVQIPNNESGIELETGFQVTMTGPNEDEKEITPINLSDYMSYNFCVQNGEVANEDEDNLILFSYRLVDKAKKQSEAEAEFTIKKDVDRQYLTLIRSTDPKERIKINHILEIIGGEYGDGIVTTSLSDIQKEMELEKVKNRDLMKFKEILEDKQLELKALIRNAISAGSKLTLEGNTYFFGSKALGSLTDTIGYFNDPNNAKDRQIIIEALKR